MALKMLTPEERKKRGQKVGFILFDSKAWKKRKQEIEDRVAKKQI